LREGAVNIRISIAMTTYNGERYLAQQLESFTRQSRLPDEIVVCDDRSTDRTFQILGDFAKRAPFEVRVLQNPANLGHERNFSQAVTLARGDIIFLADQDDAWYPEKLSVVDRAFAADREALLFVNDVLIADWNLEPTGRTVLGQMRAAGVIGRNAKSLTLGCATAIRSRLRDLVSPIPSLNYGHDSWIHDFTEALGGRRVLDQVLQLYRRHDANASNWAFNSRYRASPIDVMKPSAGKDLTSEYERRLRALALMRERVLALGTHRFAEVCSSKSFEAVLQDIERAMGAVSKRTGMFRLGWFGRKALACRMLLSGDYRHFLGWRSFAKDLIR
jgi:glycosyltransferase involved in cell wall biosynthesis